MAVDAWTELVLFSCGRCLHEWSLLYDLLEARGPAGVERQYYSRDGIATGSPYAADSCPRCQSCMRPVTGRLLDRRPAEQRDRRDSAVTR